MGLNPYRLVARKALLLFCAYSFVFPPGSHASSVREMVNACLKSKPVRTGAHLAMTPLRWTYRFVAGSPTGDEAQRLARRQARFRDRHDFDPDENREGGYDYQGLGHQYGLIGPGPDYRRIRGAAARVGISAGALLLVGGVGGHAMLQPILDDVELQDINDLERKAKPSVIYDRNGKVIGKKIGLNDNEELMPDPISIDQIPDTVIHALMMAEDQAFFDHNGVDPKGVARAFIRNIQAGGMSEGASTITMQTIKRLLDHDFSGLERKVWEAFMATRAEEELFSDNSVFSFEKTREDVIAHHRKVAERSAEELMPEATTEEKEEFISKVLSELDLTHKRVAKYKILELYLNNVFFGNRLYGIQAAAQGYFGVDPMDLTKVQAMALVGAVRNPAQYGPRSRVRAKPTLTVKDTEILSYQRLHRKGGSLAKEDQTEENAENAWEWRANVIAHNGQFFEVLSVRSEELHGDLTHYMRPLTTKDSKGKVVPATYEQNKLDSIKEPVFHNLSSNPSLSAAQLRSQHQWEEVEGFTENVYKSVRTRNKELRKHLAAGDITREEFLNWHNDEPIETIPNRQAIQHPYLVDAVIAELSREMGVPPSYFEVAGLEIHTGIDLDLQKKVQDELENTLSEIEASENAANDEGVQTLEEYKAYVQERRAKAGRDALLDDPAYLQGMAMAADGNGTFIYYIPGRDYYTSQFDAAQLGRFKFGMGATHLNYAAMLEKRGPDPQLQVSTVNPSNNVIWIEAPKEGGNKRWPIPNWNADPDGDGLPGSLPVVDAIATGNVGSAYHAMRAAGGVKELASFYERMGVSREGEEPLNKLGLGEQSKLNPLEMLRATSAFANNGRMPSHLHFVTRVHDPATGDDIRPNEVGFAQAIQPATARIVTEGLQRAKDPSSNGMARDLLSSNATTGGLDFDLRDNNLAIQMGESYEGATQNVLAYSPASRGEQNGVTMLLSIFNPDGRGLELNPGSDPKLGLPDSQEGADEKTLELMAQMSNLQNSAGVKGGAETLLPPHLIGADPDDIIESTISPEFSAEAED